PADRIGPFFEFKSNRLGLLSNNQKQILNISTANPPTLAYADPYGSLTYAYFSSYKTRNGYNRYFNAQNNPSSDCAALGVWPYAESNSIYLNPETFQIISAGADKAFGQGTNLTVNPLPFWDLASHASSAALSQAGSPAARTGLDDMSNFHQLLLGN